MSFLSEFYFDLQLNIILFLYRRMKMGNLINENMHLTAHHSWESLNLCWRKWLPDLKNTSHLMDEWQIIFQRDTMGLPWCTETKELTWALCITNARQIYQFHTRWLTTWYSPTCNKTTKIFLLHDLEINLIYKKQKGNFAAVYAIYKEMIIPACRKKK